MTYLLALDQGTSSSRSIVFDVHGHVVALAQRELPQIYPQPGWVEHDPMEIWHAQLATARQALAEVGLTGSDISALGITNQRETTIVWNRKTGQPIHHAIVWQDRRGEPVCAQLRAAGPCCVDPVAHRPADRLLLLGHQDQVAPGQRDAARASRPGAANWRSARWTAGCCGN